MHKRFRGSWANNELLIPGTRKWEQRGVVALLQHDTTFPLVRSETPAPSIGNLKAVECPQSLGQLSALWDFPPSVVLML